MPQAEAKPGKRARQKAQTRQRLIDASSRLFMELGAEQATTTRPSGVITSALCAIQSAGPFLPTYMTASPWRYISSISAFEIRSTSVPRIERVSRQRPASQA